MKQVVIAGFISAVICIFSHGSANALQADDQCKDVEIVFARGSGQALNATEAERFESQLRERLGDEVTYHSYELGTEEYDGAKYPAVNVSNWWNGNAIGAFFSSGQRFDYGNSVAAGKAELRGYLERRGRACPDERIILGGYSQGAQAVGEASRELPGGISSRVDFVALFGDPKLYLPEGEGLFPPACDGKNLSPWRRDIINCRTDNGALGARKPYLSVAYENKTGLWCNDKDFVCGTSKSPLDTENHLTYGASGAAVDKAAREAAMRLKESLAPEKAGLVDVRIFQHGTGTTGLDVVFVIDTTGSMGGPIDQAKEFARTFATTIKEMRGRVALVAYKDAGDEYAAKLMSGFDDDLTDFQAKLDSLTASGGGDNPEGLLHALNVAFDGLEWKAGATKAAVVLTDEGYHDPDKTDGATEDFIAKRALEIDPVNIYAIVPWYMEEAYVSLTEKTSGQIIRNDGDTTAALTTALTQIKNRPTALLKLAEYSANPGHEIRFDASDSYVINAEITKYEWDFNGDGTFDRTTTEPVTNYTYTEKFDGHMQVRLTANNGTVASASAVVKIGTKVVPVPPKPPKNLTVKVLETKDGQSRVRLSWQLPEDSRAALWRLRIDDMPMGVLTPERTSVEITDVLRDQDVTFSLEGLLEDYTPGQAESVTLEKEAQAPPPENESWLAKLLTCIKKVVEGLLGKLSWIKW